MAENYVLLETIELTQSAASVTFDNLPTSGYTDLKVVASTRSDVNSVEALVMSINGSTANFTYRFMDSGAGTPRSGTAKVDGIVNGTNFTASTFSSNEIYIPNYRSSNFKSFGVEYVTENNASAGYNGFTAGLWSQTAVITSLTFARATSGNFVAGSTFSLYGVAAFGTTPVLAPLATGGNIVANDGTYWYHAFTSSGNFVPQTELTADCLVIAGGGAGGGQNSGGGGAGGLRSATNQVIASSVSLPVLIGAGGTQVSSGIGNNGGNSSFNGLVSAGGGGGAGGTNNEGYAASNGGSGGGTGGGGNNNPPAGTVRAISSPTTTPAQGNSGGLWAGMLPSNGFSGGGGGGAGAQGSDATAVNGSYGGVGGIGSTAFSSWGAATLTGQLSGGTYYFAGGGGGYSGFNGSAPAGAVGGLGGGGQGWASAQGNGAGFPGLPNTGGGGGGGQPTGGTGGSGIVIIRYPMV